MRLILAALAVALAGCAQPPRPIAPISTAPMPAPDPRPAQPARNEVSDLVDELLANPAVPAAAIVGRRAEASIPAAGPGAAARRERERAVTVEATRLTRLATAEMRRRREADRRRDEAARRQDYCQDLAHNIFVRTARTSDFFAASALGRSSEMERYYQDCMASFARTDRLIGR